MSVEQQDHSKLPTPKELTEFSVSLGSFVAGVGLLVDQALGEAFTNVVDTTSDITPGSWAFAGGLAIGGALGLRYLGRRD